jgi:hypothetical protein
MFPGISLATNPELVSNLLTVSLVVAKISPSWLISIALREELCAGIMLTFPVASSTN